MKRCLLLIALVGCGDSGELAAMRTAFENAKETVVSEQKATAEKTTEAVSILKENTAALARIENKLEASLAKSEPQNGKDGDPASAPNPPAKANTQQAPLKVATPGAFRTASDGTRLRWSIEGNWNPTILQTSAHLREHGIDTNGMTHQQMADLHADLHEGKTAATKAKPVVLINRGSNCPGGVCPTSVRTRRGLFGWFR